MNFWLLLEDENHSLIAEKIDWLIRIILSSYPSPVSAPRHHHNFPSLWMKILNQHWPIPMRFNTSVRECSLKICDTNMVMISSYEAMSRFATTHILFEYNKNNPRVLKKHSQNKNKTKFGWPAASLVYSSGTCVKSTAGVCIFFLHCLIRQ